MGLWFLRGLHQIDALCRPAYLTWPQINTPHERILQPLICDDSVPEWSANRIPELAEFGFRISRHQRSPYERCSFWWVLLTILGG